MKWIIKFENNKRIRILVKFNPEIENIQFNGQFKSNNYEWTTFSSIDNDMNMSIDDINKCIENVYDTMIKRIDVYEQLSNIFGNIASLDITED